MGAVVAHETGFTGILPPYVAGYPYPYPAYYPPASDSSRLPGGAAAWSDSGPRLERVAPLDRHPELGRRGVVDVAGTPTAFGRAWIEHAACHKPHGSSTRLSYDGNLEK